MKTFLLYCCIAFVICLHTLNGNAQQTFEEFKKWLPSEDIYEMDFSKPINLVVSGMHKTMLIFSDVNKQLVTKIIEPKAGSPFDGIGAKLDKGYFDVFILKNKRFSDIFPNYSPEPDTNLIGYDDTITLDQVALRSDIEISANRQFAVLAYSLTYAYACRTILFVYDSLANEIGKLTIDVATDQIAITDDGDYIGMVFSSMNEYAEDYSNPYKGVKIINVKNTNIEFNRIIPSVHGLCAIKSVFFTSGGTVIINNVQYGDEIFLDMESKKIYRKNINRDIDLKQLLNEGVLVRLPNGTEKVLKFSNDFIVEDMP